MSDCSPAASHEEALERFVTNGSSQSLSSLRKELAVSGEQSLLADILKQPKDSTPVQTSSPMESPTARIKNLIPEHFEAAGEAIIEAWHADRKQSTVPEDHAVASSDTEIENGRHCDSDFDADSTPLPFGHSNAGALPSEHDLKVDNFVDDCDLIDDCSYVPTALCGRVGSSNIERDVILAEAGAVLDDSVRVEEAVLSESESDNFASEEAHIIFHSVNSEDSAEDEDSDIVGDSFPIRFRETMNAFKNGRQGLQCRERNNQDNNSAHMMVTEF